MHFNTQGRLSAALGLMAAAAIMAPTPSRAQSQEVKGSEWYIGLGSGMHFSNLSYSDLDKDLYPENKFISSGSFSIFAEVDFGKNHAFAVRPQFSFIKRGGKLTNIGEDYFENYDFEADDPLKLNDVIYGLRASYFDIRVPLIYQIGKPSWNVRPYVYIAPIVGFVTGGHICSLSEFADGATQGFRYDLTKGNIASTMFAGAIGIGAKWQFNVSGSTFFLGLDLSYQRVFTNTYSQKEKDGKDNVVSFFPTKNKVTGSRCFNGLEFGVNLGVPLSVFKKKTPAPVVVEEVIIPEPVVEAPVIIEEEKPCYTLDEIITLIAKGESVSGKTICAIEDVNFETGKSEIKPASFAYLNKLAETLKRINGTICVKGHTDNVGSEEFNLELSRKRALAVKSYLEDHGVDKSKLTYEYYGMSRPLTDNSTEEGRLLNRRVEIEIRK